MTTLPVIEETQGIYFTNAIQVTTNAVLNKLNLLNANKSAGPDGLHPRVLKELAVSIANPICFLMNKCFAKGKIPIEWKTANVCCIFKKGSKLDPGNYRPISLTNILCKMAESFIKEAVYEHLGANNILSNCQHGFRTHMSCITQLLEVTEALTKRYEEGLTTDIIYLDFQKAFDKVPHNRLIRKQFCYGIRGRILDFIADFLFQRKQRVIVNEVHSEWEIVLSGIPQGSILGPLLFIIFINDLPNEMTNLCKMFADDTKIIGCPGKSLQDDVDRAVRWGEKWQMQFNATKCNLLHFGKNNTHFRYVLNTCNANTSIDNPESEKDLGIFFENEYSFQMHVNKTANRANVLAGLIRRSFNYMDSEMFLTLYCTLVRPILEYGVVIWYPILRRNINKIEAVQRRATKLVHTIRHMTYRERLIALNLYSLTYRRRRGDLIQVYRIIHSHDNLKVTDFFNYMGVTRTRGHCLRFTKVRCTNSTRRNYFTQRIINDWNGLPTSAILATSINIFKKEVDKHLKNDLYMY